MNNLETVLGQDKSAVEEKLKGQWQVTAGDRVLVLFGAGPMGQIALAGLRHAGKMPVAFADNNASLWGIDVGGVPVLSPEAAVNKYGSSAAFVVTIYNPSQVCEQLRALGCQCVVDAATLWRANVETMGPHGALDSVAAIFDRADDVRAAYHLMADEESREEFLAQLRWRTEPGPVQMSRARPGSEIYFPDDLFALHGADSFVDCGAFDGDTLRMVLRRRGESFAHFTGFEPDPDNFAQFESFVATLPESQRSKIQCVNAATGARRETVRFHAIGTAGSGISGEGEMEMDCVRIDDALASVPTFVKMDIEGAEPDALEGARATLENARPILAVCVYHAMEHLWTVPLLMKQFQPDYKLYLRRYAEDCWELVVYAVPPERQL